MTKLEDDHKHVDEQGFSEDRNHTEKLITWLNSEGKNCYNEFIVMAENPARNLLTWLENERSGYEDERQKLLERSYEMCKPELKKMKAQRRGKTSKLRRALKGIRNLLSCAQCWACTAVVHLGILGISAIVAIMFLGVL